MRMENTIKANSVGVVTMSYLVLTVLAVPIPLTLTKFSAAVVIGSA